MTCIRYTTHLATLICCCVVGCVGTSAHGDEPNGPAETTESSFAERASLGTMTANERVLRDPSQLQDEPFPEPQAPPVDGLFFRVSGMSVDPQSDARLAGGGTVGTEAGFGFSLAVGYKYPGVPVTVEVEYAYRRFETDSFTNPITASFGETRFRAHTLAVNVLYDQPRLLGPVGLYAGLGLGVGINEFQFSSGTGGSSIGINGEDLFWQAMAGVSVHLGGNVQLLGGVRWADGGSINDGVLTLDTEMLSIEAGFRVFF